MADSFEDDVQCAKGLAVLEDHLGPMQALRFLALISRQPVDYQHWREQYFGKMRLAEMLAQARAAQTQMQQRRP
jgi:hypothetical protein